MAEEDLIELKFRLFDGTDIGPIKYKPSTTVQSLKEFVISRWPQGTLIEAERILSDKDRIMKELENKFPYKDIAPRTINDVKLINAGKILDNHQTIAESRVPVGELPSGLITMHVVVRPPVSGKNDEKQLAEARKQNRCGCTIL